MKPKVMVIGLDGATFKVLKPLAEQGILPNFAELYGRGCRGVLKSTVPPYTPTAWSSFYTGVNPGKHGIFSFTRTNPVDGQREVASSRLIRGEKLWQILNRHGLRTGLINLPLTYPPDEVDGFMVTGMMTPENSTNFTWPASIARELASLRQPYVVDVPVTPAIDCKGTEMITRLRAAVRGRAQATLHLMEKYPCDLMMTVFVAPDRIQHVYWKYLDENSGLHDTPTAAGFRKDILACFRELDDALGEILAAAGSGCQVFVMSDHGFCDLHSEFYLNNWLASEGFLSLGRSGLLRGAYARLRSTPLIRRFAQTRSSQAREAVFRRMVDWHNTLAYVHEQGLFINIKGAREQGSAGDGERYLEVRDLIAEKLREFTDPATGKAIVDSLSFKEELYHGGAMEGAPDIVAVLDDYGCYIRDGVMYGSILKDCTGEPFGTHDPDGIFLATGPDILSGADIKGAGIVDVAPTILHALGLPVPENMDGRVLEDIFEREFIERNPVKRAAAADGSSETEDVYSQQEAEEIQNQLRGMGYLS